MAIITTEDLQKFTGVYPETEDSQQQLYIDTAIEIICSYLKFNPEKKEYTLVLDGNGREELLLPALPINSVESLIIDGRTIATETLLIKKRSIYGAIFSKGRNNIIIAFNAGFDVIPATIKLTALRIAGILQTESNNNIGINSKSFQDTGTRTFVNTVNFDKYLIQISEYKLI